MSLFNALSTAVSSINALNTAVRTVSDNVANANNPDYNRREESFESLQYGGVRIGDIRRITNTGLQRDLFSQTADAEANSVRNRLYEQIEQLTGTVSNNTPLSDSVERFRTAWKAFEAAPESNAAADEVILAGEAILNEIERLSDGLDLIENQVLVDIDNRVNDLNTALAEVDRLNNAIVREKSNGRPTSQLENLRDKQLETVSGLIDVRTFEREDGSISVYTSSGLDLTDRNASTFTWNAANHTLTKSGSPSSDLITGGQLPDGELKALIDFIRTDQAAQDSTGSGVGALEKMRNHLDELSYSLVDDATRATQSTATMASGDLLVGDLGLTAGDSFTIDVGGGAVTVPSGGGPLGAGIDAADTVQDLLDELNTIPDVRARLTAHGRLEISTVNGTDLTLADTGNTPLQTLGLIGASPTTVPERDPPTFANAYANTTTEAGEAANFFEVEAGTTPDNASRTNIRVNDTLSAGTETLKKLSGTDVVAALNAQNRSMGGSAINLSREDYTGLAAGILTDFTKRAENANTRAEESEVLRADMKQALRDEVGVNIDEEMARLTVLQNSYAASARVIESVNQMLQQLEQAAR